MIKRITALLLSICLLLSAAPVYAGAAAGQRVSANAVTVTAGNTAYVTLTAENFENIAALDVYVYYDPAIFTVGGTYTGWMLSGAQASINSSEAGTIKLSAMALDGISGTGELMSVCFRTNYACKPGTYPISVAVGRAYDGNLTEAAISGAGGSVTVVEPVETEAFYIYGYTDRYTCQKNDQLTFYLQSAAGQSFVSGEFVVTYDHELFRFESVTLQQELTGEGAVYSVNSSVLGQVRIAYANDDPVFTYQMLTIRLRVIADTNTQTHLMATANNVYRENLKAYLPGSTSATVELEKLPEIVDHPDAFMKTEMLVTGEQSRSVFYLEADAGVAAADFAIAYDPAVLRCVSVAVAEELNEKGGMVVINDNFSAGIIRFSYVNMQSPDGELPLVEITWEPISSPKNHYQNSISAVGVVDAKQNPITLEFVTDTNCIYAVARTEPTCQKEGKISYLCHACQDLQEEILPALSEEDCTHYTVLFLDEDGTELSRQTCHYGDAVVIPQAPEKEKDETYTYTFTGWDKPVVDCDGDAVYTAIYTSNYIEYTVTFVDEDGTELSGKTYHWGDPVTAPADPTKAADNTYTYAFAGWDKEIVNCAGDAVYTATYTSDYIDYTVIFQYADGTPILETTYHYGDPVTAPEAPAATQGNCVFVGWDKAITDCTGDAVYTAVFEKVFTPGDLDGNGIVDEDDVIYLLQHLLMPEDFVVEQPVDYDKSGSIDEDDVIYLLQHLLMPEDFPLC